MERIKIVFVCTGNICRSPIAQALCERSILDIPELGKYTICSAGTHAQDGIESTRMAQIIAQTNGLSLVHHRAKLLDQSMVDEAVAIIGATSAHEEFFKKHFINLPKIHTSFAKFGGDIADPYGGDLESYKKVADEIKERLPLIIEFLKKELHDH